MIETKKTTTATPIFHAPYEFFFQHQLKNPHNINSCAKSKTLQGTISSPRQHQTLDQTEAQGFG